MSTNIVDDRVNDIITVATFLLAYEKHHASATWGGMRMDKVIEAFERISDFDRELLVSLTRIK